MRFVTNHTRLRINIKRKTFPFVMRAWVDLKIELRTTVMTNIRLVRVESDLNLSDTKD